MAGVIALPGLAIWRKWPIVGALLFIAGVIAPGFVVIMVLQHRDAPLILFTRTEVLRWTVLVCVAAIFSRFIAVWLTADRLRDPFAQRRMRLLGSAAVLVLAVPTGYAVKTMETGRRAVDKVFVNESKDEGRVTAAEEIDPLAGEFQTVLLMGTDEGADRIGLRTDTMIIAMIHASGRVALISVPRNLTSVRFPPGSPLAERYPNGYEDDEGGLINALYNTVENDEELTAAYQRDDRDAGVAALVDGLSYSLGLTINDYAMVNSCGFVKVVDAIGGITIDLDTELPMPAKLRCSNYRLPPTIGPGETYMDGTKALGYVRSRMADDDYHRMERQRILLQTISSSVGVDDMVLHFGELMEALGDNVRTSMTNDEALGLLGTLQDTDLTFESIGLAPPLVEPGHPDYAEVKDVMQQIRRSLSADTALNLPTETTATAATG